jgi:hypothetical protein
LIMKPSNDCINNKEMRSEVRFQSVGVPIVTTFDNEGVRTVLNSIRCVGCESHRMYGVLVLKVSIVQSGGDIYVWKLVVVFLHAFALLNIYVCGIYVDRLRETRRRAFPLVGTYVFGNYIDRRGECVKIGERKDGTGRGSRLVQMIRCVKCFMRS